MKITEIRTFLLPVKNARMPRMSQPAFGRPRGANEWLFVKIVTDGGVHGVGECSGWPKVTERAIQEIASSLVGKDPQDSEGLWETVQRSLEASGMTGAVSNAALSGIDMALWDIKARLLGKPVWSLIGERQRADIPVFGYADTKELADELRWLGYQTFKCRVRNRKDVKKVHALGDYLGQEAGFIVTGGGPPWLAAEEALSIARDLRDANVLYFENPVPPEDLKDLVRLRNDMAIPIAVDERISSLHDVQPFVEMNLIDVIQPDVGRVGGMLQATRIAALADRHRKKVAPFCATLGPVAEYAALHIMTAIPNALPLGRLEFGWRDKTAIAEPALSVENGVLKVPEAPGLGVDLNDDELARRGARIAVVAAEKSKVGWRESAKWIELH